PPAPRTRAPTMRYPNRCQGITRRSFLSDTGMGFTGLALAAMLHDEARAAAPPSSPDRTKTARATQAKAKNVIWIFLCGGVSHVESFDVKPELTKFAGKSIDATPYKKVFDDSRIKDIVAANPAHGGRRVLMGLNTGHKQHGKCGLTVA